MSLIPELSPEEARQWARRRVAETDRLRRARELAARLRAAPPAPPKPPEPALHPAVAELPKWWQGSALANAQLYWIEALKHGEYGENPPRITTPVIMAVVAERHGQSVFLITGQDRYASVAAARFEAIYLTRAITKRSYPDIGRSFGKRDHSTIINACARYAERAGLPLVDDIGREQAIKHMIRQ